MSELDHQRTRLNELFTVVYKGEHEQLTEAEVESKRVVVTHRMTGDALMGALFAIIGTQYMRYRVSPQQQKLAENLLQAYWKSREDQVRIHGEDSIPESEWGVIRELLHAACIKYPG